MTTNTAPKNTTPHDDLARSIPTFDMTAYDTDFDSFAQKIGDGIQEFGFCGLKNHGVDDAQIARVFNVMEKFFALPDDVKRKYYTEGQGGQRGYTPFKFERAKDSKESDLKEFWHVGRELSEDTRMAMPDNMRLLPNVWPDAEVPEFRPVMTQFYETLDRLSSQVLQALAVYLKIDRHFFDERTDMGDSILRALHYPPQPDLTGEAIRAGAHEDINLITLLVGSNEPGLEIKDNFGRWIPVTTLEGTIVCNIGDMLQRFTNHVFPSKTHRVINPEGNHRKHSRYSIPFFKHLNRNCMIETIDSCITPDNPQKDQPISAHAYLIQRLIEIDLIPHNQIPAMDLPLFALEEVKENLIKAGRPVPQELSDEITKKTA